MSIDREFPVLTPDVALQYAMRVYDNPSCVDLDEFKKDVESYRIISRLLLKYKKYGVLKERQLINALVLFTNVFKGEAGIRLLFCLVDKQNWSGLKTTLLFLRMCPPVVKGVPMDINTSDIPVDMEIANILRKFTRDNT